MKTTLLFLSVFLSTTILSQVVFVDHFDAVYSFQNPISAYFDINSDGENDIRMWNTSTISSMDCISTTNENIQCNSGIRGYFQGFSNTYGQNLVNTNGGYADSAGIDCSNDDELNILDSWGINGGIHYGCSFSELCVSVGFGNHKQGFRLLVPNPANNQNAYLYGYIDYTFTNNGDIIVHGWYYESQLNQPISIGGEPPLELTELTTSKNLIQILDLMGRETTFKPNTPLIYVYDDGSTEKVFRVEY